MRSFLMRENYQRACVFATFTMLGAWGVEKIEYAHMVARYYPRSDSLGPFEATQPPAWDESASGKR